jgi:hypothetical protein
MPLRGARPPFIAIVPGTKRPGAPGTASKIIRLDDACCWTAGVTCDPCLFTQAAEAAYGRRVAHDYLGTCAITGHHHDAEALADCANPNATVMPCQTPSFCAHGKPVENCIVHAPRRPQPAMPAKLARRRSCLGYTARQAATAAHTARRRRPP